MNSTVCISPQNSLIFQLPHSRRKIICFNCLKDHSIRSSKPTISQKPTIVIPENIGNYFIQRTKRKIKTTRSEIIIFRNLRAAIMKSENNDIRNQVQTPYAETLHSSSVKIFTGTSVLEMNHSNYDILSTVIVYIKGKFGGFQVLRRLIEACLMNNFKTIQCSHNLEIKKEKNTISGFNGASINLTSGVNALIENNSDFKAEIELCVTNISDAVPVIVLIFLQSII